MKIEIKHKYLIFPVNTTSAAKTLTFNKDGVKVYELSIKLDNDNPNFYSYLDVSRFKGQILDLSVAPEMKLEYRESDEMKIENLYHEPMRPLIHFSTKNGWINDPNGLLYVDGTYHMFYQYNPAEPNWENMHWGHAVSGDLIHWEEKDVALFPDERGHMFSGCAILDEKNILGKNEGDNKAALLFYTTTAPFCQRMSYSVDDFKTINHIDKPVVPHIKGGNRDPKVVFCDEMDCYVMALYLDGDIYIILKSKDLINWEQINEIHLIGDNECPDIFPLYDNEGARKWVIIGAHDKYLVGNFDNGRFVEEQPVLSLHYGTSGYAGQSFTNLPNDRIVRVVYDRWGLPGYNFSGQMGIPMEMSLDKFEETYYLQANPIEEIRSICNLTKTYENVCVDTETPFAEALLCDAQMIRLKGIIEDSGQLNITVFGKRIGFDFSSNEITVGDCTSPISITRSELDVTIVVDKCSIEVFADGGKIFVSCLNNWTIMDFNVPELNVCADKKMVLESIEVSSLNSIWD